MRVYIISLWLLACTSAYAQEYRFKHYTLAEGLPSEIIKSIAQDSSGYFWSATDEGLVKYDGIQFTSYRHALSSQYAKGFYTTSEGKLLLFGDLDLVEIINDLDTVYFKPIHNGLRNPSDTTLWYPKALYEDKHHRLWVSEPQSVVLLQQSQIKRFSFSNNDLSPQFLRSFTFFEDRKGNLFTTSIWGKVFQYSSDKNQFDSYGKNFTGQVWCITPFNNQLFIGTTEGLFKAALLEEGGFSSPELLYPFRDIACITPMANGQLFIGTSGEKHFFAFPDGHHYEELPFPINNINQAYVSNEGDLWLSSNEGIFIAQQNKIENVSYVNDFIEAIAEDSLNHEVYFADVLNLYKSKIGAPKDQTKLVLSLPDGYFQDIEIAHGGIWVANSFSVFFLQNGKVKKKFNFEKEGRFVADLFLDARKTLWLSQHNQPFAITIDSTFKLTRTHVPIKPGNNINVTREGHDGMYIASSGTEAYLFYKAEKDSAFKNISLPLDFEITGDFNINDIAFTDNFIWMATTEGIVCYDHKKVFRVDLGEHFTGLTAKAIEPYINGSLLFATGKGLIRYDPTTKDYWIYDESIGLNSNTITTRGLFIDSHKLVWVGTSKGLSYAKNSLTQNQLTLKPRIISFQVNGLPTRFVKTAEVPYGSFIAITVSSISFPENKVTIQYRMNEDENWKAISNSIINLSELKSGAYTIYLRAKKTGGLNWSKVNSYSFRIMPPFWQRGWFIVICIFAIAFIALLSISFANIRNIKRRAQLQRLIDERTHELKLSNEELSQRNTELDRFVYSASHDLSAPLKSIMGLITIARMDKTGQTSEYFTMMETSVRKLDSFINDVVNYSRNARLEVKYKPIPFKEFIQSIWSDYQYIPETKQIRFEVIDELKHLLCSDEVRLKIIFNNLISNAIKFHIPKQREDPYIKVTAREFNSQVQFIIEDNGQGIHRDLKDKVFDMFFRATQSTPGSGLGLYILKETITKLEGTVCVESELGEGTSFTIVLPRKVESL